MTKRDLVIQVSVKLGYTQSEVSNVIQHALDTISDTLSHGERIEIRNFGVFEVKLRDARVGRNPRTGEEVAIAQKRVVAFKPGKFLKERIKADPGQVGAETRAEEPQQKREGETESSPSSSAVPSSGEQQQLF